MNRILQLPHKYSADNVTSLRRNEFINRNLKLKNLKRLVLHFTPNAAVGIQMETAMDETTTNPHPFTTTTSSPATSSKADKLYGYGPVKRRP